MCTSELLFSVIRARVDSHNLDYGSKRSFHKELITGYQVLVSTLPHLSLVMVPCS